MWKRERWQWLLEYHTPPAQFLGAMYPWAYQVLGVEQIDDDMIMGPSAALVVDLSKVHEVTSAREIIADFVRLESTEEISAFARRYGPLGLCHHHLPLTHPFLTALGDHGRTPVPGYPDLCAPFSKDERHALESIKGWQSWIQLARLLLRTAVSIRNPKFMITTEDREQLYNPPSPFSSVFASIGLDPDEFSFPEVLSHWINIWLGFSDLGLRCRSWRAGRFTLHPFAPMSVFGTIALQLALLICRAKSVALCDACGDLAFPTRLTQGRHVFCESCRDRGRWLLAKRKHLKRPLGRNRSEKTRSE
jgi:hypothetical protein